MQKETLIYKFAVFAFVFFLIGCAQQGAPTGGPEDEDPPVVLETSPENYSKNFREKKIQITFDEFINMANFTQELVVSPPMEEKPIIKMRNKTLIIEFEEDLKEDVTYTFNFGEGISDLNEGNVLLNYEFVFSTGDFLDSLSIKGALKNAFDLSSPEPPIFVMLYTELADSLPLKEIPYYVGRTDKEGNFAVNNLKKGVYKMFVLKDGNNNFLFDLPAEEIAFLDSSVMVDAMYYRQILLESGVYDSTDLLPPDTLQLPVDTTGMSADSVAMILDSLDQNKPDFNTLYIDLYMFTEKPVNQFISDYNRDKRRILEMLFNLPLTDSFRYQPVFPDTLSNEDFIADFGMERDSLTLWTGDTLVAALDTIVFALQYTALDTLGLPVYVNDTLLFNYRESSSKKKTPTGTGGQNKAIKVSTIGNRGNQHPKKDIVLTLEAPLKELNSEMINLFVVPDSIDIPVEFNATIDSNHLSRVRIPFNWEEEGNYKLIMYPGAMKNIYGETHDTLIRSFSIKPLSEYGIVNLALENVTDTLMLEIYKKNNVYRRQKITSDGTYSFEYMEPETYRFKFIHDRNGNGKWDTGKYMDKRQPEKVEFIPRDLKVRANWDHDISYVLGSNDSPPKGPDEEEDNEGSL